MAYDEKSASLEIARLRNALQRAEEQVATLEKRVASLEAQLAESLTALEEARRWAARQAAPFRREENQKVAPEERKKPGRKPGHRGTSRSIPPHIDQEIEIPLPSCPQCGGEVSDRAPLTQWI